MDPRARRAAWRGAALIAIALAAAACTFPETGGLFGASTTNGGGVGGAGGDEVGATTSTTVTTTTSTTTSTTTGSTTSTGPTTTSTGVTTSTGGGAVCGNGVCEPPEDQQFCPQDCSGTTGSGGGNGGACDHATCDTGGPMKADCDACTAQVCAADPYCCDQGWDGQCVGEANTMCGACCGNGACNSEEKCDSCAQDCGACPLPAECPHSVCFAGAALDPAKCWDPCTTAICAQMPDCCRGNGNAWNAACQAAAQQACPGGDPCVKAVCAKDATCCSSDWTQACIDLAKTECNTQCNCAHSICQDGDKLDPSCNPCAAAVCASDKYCCDNHWDGICAGEVEAVCGIKCN